jgi:hypothetical protein
MKDKTLVDYVGDEVAKSRELTPINFDLNVYYKNNTIYVTKNKTGNRIQFRLVYKDESKEGT